MQARVGGVNLDVQFGRNFSHAQLMNLPQDKDPLVDIAQ
jgi:hypothetical protein